MNPRPPSPGDYVRVRRPDYVRDGVVETVLHDKSGFWLAAEGAEPRVFVFQEELVGASDEAPKSC